MPFYTERPADKYGNRGRGGPLVFEAEIRPENELRIIRPDDFARKWVTCSTLFDRYIEVPGPARYITEDEWAEVLSKAGANEWEVQAARRRANPF